MKKIVAICLLLMFLAAGTAAAAASGSVGVLDVDKIMAESPKVKALQEQLNQKARDLSQQLEAEKPNLTKEQYDQKKEAVYAQFLQLKKSLEAQVDASIQQAAEQVAKEKNLSLVLYKNSVALGGTDITPEVLVLMK